MTVAPDDSAPVVAVAVTYGFGHRDEPPGLGGVAHLFEHLAFSGSARFPGGAHFEAIQRAGGIVTAYTGLDYTQYYQVLPADSLELVLDLEADRMRGFFFDATQIARQLEIIDAEVRSKLDGKAYGGFSWQYSHETVLGKWANTHPGFVSNPDLAGLSVDELQGLRSRHYHPGNAVVSIAGAVDVPGAVRLTEKLFGELRRGEPRRRPDLSEPLPSATCRTEVIHPLIKAPAVARVFRAPNRWLATEAYYHAYLLGAVLCLGSGSPLYDSLVAAGRAVRVRSQLGVGGDPSETGEPNSFALEVFLAPGSSTECNEAEGIEKAITDALRVTARGQVGSAVVEASASRVRAGYLTKLDDLLNRARLLGLRGLESAADGTLQDIDDIVAATTADDIRESARWLLNQPERHLWMSPAEGT
ncbi:MAG TPA: pitrilysin family protein [Actinoplanes sp.]|nr:pitrilysin family protein [Actinoplanes sp.]